MARPARQLSQLSRRVQILARLVQLIDHRLQLFAKLGRADRAVPDCRQAQPIQRRDLMVQAGNRALPALFDPSR